MKDAIRVIHLLVGLGRGGAERLLVEVLPGMRRHGVQAEVVSLKGTGPVAADLESAGIPVTPLGGTGRADVRPVIRLVKLLRQRRPDLIHAHLTRAALAGHWAGRVTGTPLAVHFHSLAGERPGWQDRLEGAAARRAGARLAVSRAVATDRAARLSLPVDSITVIPNGIDVQRFAALALPCNESPVRVGYLGRLGRPEKGVDVLLDAVQQLDPHLDVRVEIAGGPPAEEEKLQREILSRGLEKKVTLCGEVADPAQALARWHLLVLPSRREGFGLALVEAMAARRPVVATTAGGIPEVVVPGGCGSLVPPEDPAALAGALAALVRDPQERRRMGEEGHRLARERFDARGTAAAWAEMARGVARRRGAA